MPTRPLSSAPIIRWKPRPCGPSRAAGVQPHGVEVERADLRGALAHLVLLASARAARRVEVDDEDAHPAVAERGVGAREHQGEVGDRRVVDPQLFAGEAPAVAVRRRRRAQAREVRPGVGLGQCVRAAPRSGEQRPEVGVALQRRCRAATAAWRPTRRARTGRRPTRSRGRAPPSPPRRRGRRRRRRRAPPGPRCRRGRVPPSRHRAPPETARSRRVRRRAGGSARRRSGASPRGSRRCARRSRRRAGRGRSGRSAWAGPREASGRRN